MRFGPQAFYFCHWFADLAGAEASPMQGCPSARKCLRALAVEARKWNTLTEDDYVCSSCRHDYQNHNGYCDSLLCKWLLLLLLLSFSFSCFSSFSSPVFLLHFICLFVSRSEDRDGLEDVMFQVFGFYCLAQHVSLFNKQCCLETFFVHVTYSRHL